MQMQFTLERVTQPEIEPVTLAEAKRHLRVSDEVGSPELPGPDDDDIAGLIVSAREWVEGFTGRALIDQTWRLTIFSSGHWPFAPINNNLVAGPITGITRWPLEGLLLRRSPIIALGTVSTIDRYGVATELQDVGSPELPLYAVRAPSSKWPRLVAISGTTWTIGTLAIEYRAGYADRDMSPQQGAEAVPMRFKQAMKLWIEAMYDRDEKMMPLLLKTAEDLIRQESCELGMA